MIMSAEDNFVAKFDRLLRHLQIEVEIATPDFARVRMPLTEHHLNGWGAAHGGVICALVDAAFGSAANDSRETAVVTLSTTIDFLRPGLKGPLVAEAKATHTGTHIINYDVKVKDGDGKMIARAITSGYVTNIAIPDRQDALLQKEMP